MNPKNILKVAKNWHFKNQNKPIRLHRQICLSKITLRALIGQKQNKGDSCFSCPVSVSSNHKSKHRHAVKSHCRNLKCNSLQNTEVSHMKELPVNFCKLRHQYLDSPGQKSIHQLKTCDDKPSWLHPWIKVRNLTKVCYLIISKITRFLKSEAFTGYIMAKTNKNPEKGGEKSNERGHKDLGKSSKSSKKSASKTAKQDVVNPENFKDQLAAVIKTVKKRSSSKTVENVELSKHLSAIQGTMNKSPAPRKEKKKSQKTAPKSPQITEPVVPDNEAPKTPERIDTSGSPIKSRKTIVKRKRKAIRIKSEPESESSESRKRVRKRTKISRIHETTEEQSSSSEDLEDVVPGESPRARHRRIQALIRAGKTGSREIRTRLNNRSNTLFHQVTKEGRKITRRNPNEPFKDRPKKPATGASITQLPDASIPTG